MFIFGIFFMTIADGVRPRSDSCSKHVAPIACVETHCDASIIGSIFSRRCREWLKCDASWRSTSHVRAPHVNCQHVCPCQLWENAPSDMPHRYRYQPIFRRNVAHWGGAIKIDVFASFWRERSLVVSHLLPPVICRDLSHVLPTVISVPPPTTWRPRPATCLLRCWLSVVGLARLMFVVGLARLTAGNRLPDRDALPAVSQLLVHRK